MPLAGKHKRIKGSATVSTSISPSPKGSNKTKLLVRSMKHRGSCIIKNSSEVCYNVRYMERNERNRGSPWSLRQTGVYQRYDTIKQSSVWILLHPSDYMRRRLSETMRHGSDFHCDISTGPLHLHGLFLSASERNWSDYIEHTQREIESLVSQNNHNIFPNIG